MYSVACVNQFEIKSTCIEFEINNVSPQGKCEDKIQFKNKFAEIAVLIFCEMNDSTSGFCFALSRYIHNPVKLLI